jgi:hypothetical protein
MNDLLNKINLEKIKPLAIAGVCFLTVFIAGFGAGRITALQNSTAPAKRSLNYTTNIKVEQKQDNTNNTAATGDLADCPVKGSSSKIYHVKGGAFYERTKAAQCFDSEAAAQAAGYRKSSR